MGSMEKTLSSWRKLILANDLTIVHREFELALSEKKWTTEQEVQIANYCLVAVNMKAHEAHKNNSQDVQFIQQIFTLAELCCSLIEKTWECNSVKFLGSIYNICRYLLSQNYVYETMVISQYGMEFLDTLNANKLSEEEIRSVKALLFLHLQYINAFDLTADNAQISIDIWKFILSPEGFVIKDSNVTVIMETLQYFFSKTRFISVQFESSIVLLSYLNEIRFKSLVDTDVCSFIGICRTMINHIGPIDAKKTVSSIIKCIDSFGISCTEPQRLVCQFCCDILRFSIYELDTSVPDFVSKCRSELKTLSSLPQLLVNHAIYFASMILMYLRHYWVVDDFYYTSCIQNTFKFLLELSTTMLSVDMSQILKTKNVNTKDHLYPIYLASFILTITNRVSDLDSVTLKKLYSHVYAAMEICLIVYDQKCVMDAKQKSSMCNVIAATSVNVCRVFMKAELHTEWKELSLMAAQKIAALSSAQLLEPVFKPCVEKLVLCLHNAFKNLNQYEEALRTACVWTAKLPDLEKTFMSAFASLKAKILTSDNTDRLDFTCWDILIGNKRQTQSIWRNINLKDVNIISLLRCELQQYVTYHVNSATLVEKIVRIVDEQEDITTKIEFYVLAGLIFTQSNTCVENAVKLLPPIDSFIDELKKKNKAKIAKEKRLMYSLLLGNLHHTKFRIKLLHARCINEKEVILTESIKAPTSSLELGMEQESKDVSDIVHKYLTYQSQQELIGFLDTALNYWNDTITDVKNKMDLLLLKKCSKIANDSNIFTFIQEAALMYRLYCHQTKESNAWKLLHTLSVMCDDNDMAIHAFSNLLLLPGNADLNWENEAENKLASVTENIRTRYRLETANKLLIKGLGSEGAEILSTISEEDIKNHEILWARYHFIVGQYEWAGFCQTTYSPLLTAFKAYCKILSWIKKNSWKNFHEACEGQSLLFDITLFIGNLYCGTYQIIEAKCYLKEHVKLIQKLCLPLKICQFLIALCQVSVITCNVEDIYAKLNALKSVLKFNHQNRRSHYIEPPSAKFAVTLSPEMNLNSDVRFASNFTTSDFYSSPVLESGLKFETPDFIYHSPVCECAACKDMLYQQISCEVMLLFGTYFYRAGKCGQASHHFKASLEMLNTVQNRWNNADPANDQIFVKLQIITKIRQSDFWASCGDFEKAEMFNEQASSDYNNLIVPDRALYGDLRDQFRALKLAKTNAAVEEVLPIKKLTRQRQPLPITISKTPAAKTPAAKSSIAIYEDDEDTKMSTLIKKMDITPFPKHSRRVLFEDDETFATPCKPLPSARSTTSRIARKREETTPPDIVMQTPSSIGTRARRVTKNTKESKQVEQKTRLRARNK